MPPPSRRPVSQSSTSTPPGPSPASMSTILTTLAATYSATQPPQITFLSLDAEEVSDVSERYDVTQVPLVVLQKDGQVVEAVTGTDAARVRNAVEKHAGSAASTGAG